MTWNLRRLPIPTAFGMATRVITLHSPKRWPAQKAALVELAAASKKLTPAVLARYLHRTSHDKVPEEDFRRTEAIETLGVHDAAFFTSTVPFIAKLALCSTDLFPSTEASPLRYLPPSEAGTVRLSRLHVASVLALAFFDAIAPHEFEGADDWDFPEVPTCRYWLGVGDIYGGNPCDEQKAVCLLHFFQRAQRTFARDLSPAAIAAASTSAPEAQFTVSRLVLPAHVTEAGAAESAAVWVDCNAPLLPLTVVDSGGIEGAPGALQADFANEYLGGGVLMGGNVQEEIRFSICPECLVSMLVCPRMRPHEAVLLTGVKQYATYSGYGDRFECTGPAEGPSDNSAAGAAGGAKRRTRGRGAPAAPSASVAADADADGVGEHLIAIDAVPYAFQMGARAQYNQDAMLRELLKLRAALGDGGGYDDEQTAAQAPGEGEPSPKRPATKGKHAAAVTGSIEGGSGSRRPFATGNWGCGVFGGDARLKALLQWMAASRAGRAVLYFPFGDPRVSGLREAAEALRANEVTVGQLARVLFGAGAEALSNGRAFAHVEAKLANGGR